MKTYQEIINKAELVLSPNVCITTGDLEYEGTALEVSDKTHNELFHVVIGENCEKQLLFWPQKKTWRININKLEEIIEFAKNNVHLPE